MYAFCWSCPSATFASQHGGFVPREWQATKGLFETTKMLHCLFCRMNPPLVWIQLPDAFSGIHWQVSWKTDAPSCWRHTGTRIRDLKIRRRRGQRERYESNRLRYSKRHLCMCSTLFCSFLCHHRTATTWKCLISRFREDVKKSRRNCLSLSELMYHGC